MRQSTSFQRLGLACLAMLLLTVSALAQEETIGQEGSGETVPALDRLVLKSGNEIRGQIINPAVVQDGRTYVLFRTENGGLLKLEKGSVVRRAYPADDVVRDYHEKLRALDDTTDAHWAMYQWLSRQKGGASRFKHEREGHLRRIIELDPTDEKALNLLDYQNLNGRWIDKDLLHSYHGYVSEGGKWMPELQFQVNQRAEEQRQAKGDRNGQLKKWARYVLGKENPSVVQQQLFALVDADSLDLVDKMMKGENRPDVRRMMIEAIGRVPSSFAQSLLVRNALLDPELKVRERAVVMLEQPHYVPFRTTSIAAGYLAHPDNVVVRRTCRLIGFMGADNGPYYLTRSLVTQHKMATGNQPGRTKGSFSNDGNLQSFGVGGGPAQKVVSVENDEALDALRNYSGKDYGFDVSRWKAWFIENHVITEDDLRRDD
ncbi:MAG: hypothetical protein VYE64_00780 [Planctomycetota bacterium]|nr:hypothetical protein [Planctomycetota bacterium]